MKKFLQINSIIFLITSFLVLLNAIAMYFYNGSQPTNIEIIIIIAFIVNVK